MTIGELKELNDLDFDIVISDYARYCYQCGMIDQISENFPQGYSLLRNFLNSYKQN